MNLNIIKPNKENFYTYLTLGIILLSIGFIDIFSNTFLNLNITEFLPPITDPLILGALWSTFYKN